MSIFEDQLTFNVIFVPGTAALLSPFVATLLKNTQSCRFRLVANGCPPGEEDLLQELARSRPRLDFLRIPEDRVLGHGEALSRLLQREDGPFFAFLDSDIFATGEFLPDILARLESADAVFSGAPMWLYPEEGKMFSNGRYLSGEYNWLGSGECVGSSYFGIYRRAHLLERIASTGIDFRTRYWWHLPPGLRRRLKKGGFRKAFYDTGKLMNVLLLLEGKRLVYLDSDRLHHIGGISDLVMVERKAFDPVRLLRAVAPLTIRQINLCLKMRCVITRREARRMIDQQRRRRVVPEHVFKALARLETGDFPSLRRADASRLEERVSRAIQILRQGQDEGGPRPGGGGS